MWLQRLFSTILAVLAVAAVVGAPQPDQHRRRHKMVDQQIDARGIKNPEVLAALRRVERHRFVPEEFQESAYADHPLPIGYGATISQPYIVAFMTDLLQPRKTDKVLEIGTGSGYQAAVLGELVKLVYTIEIVPQLADSATRLLKDLNYTNIIVRTGDGYKGWAEEAPFDKIILTAAPPELPQALIDQLAAKGRLVAPVGGGPDDQQLLLVEKDKDGKVSRKSVLPVRFVPMVKKRPVENR